MLKILSVRHARQPAWILALTWSMFATGPSCSQASNDGTELYNQFRAYRWHLATDQPQVAGVFSRAALEAMVSEASGEVSANDVVAFIRGYLLFGSDIDAVYPHQAFAPHDGSETPRILCACKQFERGIGAVEISFVLEKGQRRINHLTFDTSATALPPGAGEIERFRR